jgi:hypothetical protein
METPAPVGPGQLLRSQTHQRQQLSGRPEGVRKRQPALERLGGHEDAVELGDDEPPPREGTSFELREPLERRVVVDVAEPQSHRDVADGRPFFLRVPRLRATDVDLDLTGPLCQERLSKLWMDHDRSFLSP